MESRSSYDVGRAALARWRKNYGNKTLDQECIRFDGYYWQWEYQGDENIRAYDPATDAADAALIYTTNVNDPDAQPGDLWYWWWGRDGHVGTVLGHDASGRVLVTHTSSSGDLVEQWSNNVRISHADTIPHKFRGGSHHYGINKQRTGLTAWPGHSKAASGGTTRKKKSMATMYEKQGSKPTLYALAGDSPGTSANWLETSDGAFANKLAETHGNAKLLSPATWESWKTRYLEPLKIAGGAG